MNVFEYLGLKPNHRSEDKIVQKVKHIDEVPESKRIWPMFSQVKKDGVFCIVAVVGGIAAFFSRTGKKFVNVEWLESEMNMVDSTDGVYIAELCNDLCSLEVLSGIVNPNRNKTLSAEQAALVHSMYLAFHDCLTLEEFAEGKSDAPYLKRHWRLQNFIGAGLHWHILACLACETEKDFDELAEFYVSINEEGVVGKPDVGWEAGHKGWRMVKKVRGVSYDLLCINVEEGKGKYKGLAANLIFRWKNGKEIKAMLGKGWTHDDARDMFVNPPIGKIFEIYALQESSKGVLRLPKVGELRHDKTKPDL